MFHSVFMIAIPEWRSLLSLLALILIDSQSPCQVEEYYGKYNVSVGENAHGGKARV